MNKVTKTMAIAILLVAILSCNKQNTDSATLSTTNHATAASSSRAISDNEDLTGLISPVGVWEIHYNWASVGHYHTSRLTVNADGTFKGGGSSGTWIDGKGIFTFMYDAPLRTTYSGTERITRIVGIMSSFNSPNTMSDTGSFYMVPATSNSFKEENAPGGPDVSGVKDTR